MDEELMQETIDLIDYLEAVESQAEEEEAQQWIVIDRTDAGCLLANSRGEVRAIGAAYIDRIFGEE